MSVVDERDAASLWTADASEVMVYTPTLSDDLDQYQSDFSDCCDSGISNSTSLLSVVCDHEYAYDRRYHGYKRGRYPLPNDVVEQQRESTKHVLMLMLTVKELGSAASTC